MDYIKYDMTDIWASGGDIVAPDATKIGQGWGVEVVPRQWWNWMQNRVDNNVAYLLQKGIPEWDATTEYLANKSFVTAGGIVYKCLITNTGLAPLTNPAQWSRAFQDYTTAVSALGALSPSAGDIPVYTSGSTATTFTSTAYGRGISNVANSTAARTYISAQADNTNLTALSGVVAATNGLPYFTGTTAMGITTLTAFGRSLIDDADSTAARTTLGLGGAAVLNVGTTAGTVAAGDDSRIVNSLQKANNLSDLTNAATARSNLGLSTGATSTVTTSSTDATGGRLLKVGDFGLGSQGVLVGDIDALGGGATGFYKLGAPFTGAPIASSAFTVIHMSYDGERTQIAVQEGITSSRVFVRKYSGGAWQSWVEQYHTGNSSGLVTQVVSAIQPTLDAKVNKSGDTMTGTLSVPSLEVGSTGVGGAGFIDLKSAGGNADNDARISVDSVTGTITGGRLVLNSALTYVNSPMTVTGLGTFQNGINSTTLSLSTALPIASGGTGATSASAALSNLGGMPLTGNTSAKPFLGAVHASRIPVGSPQGVCMGWNEDGQGRAAFVNNQGDGVGGFVFRNVNDSNTTETGRVTITGNGAVQASATLHAGSAYMNTDGNVYGSVYGNNWLTNWLAANYVNRANLGTDTAAYIAFGAVGSYALMLLGGGGSGILPGTNIAGANLRYSAASGSNNGTTATGTWRVMGYVVNADFSDSDSVTLCMRIA